MENIKIFACKSAENFTKEICDYLNLPMGKIDSFKFKNDNKLRRLIDESKEKYFGGVKYEASRKNNWIWWF